MVAFMMSGSVRYYRWLWNGGYYPKQIGKQTERARTPFVLFRYIVNRRKQDRAYFYTSFFHSLWKQFRICYVILALSLCKNMWKPERLVKEFVSLWFFYEVCLFFFLPMWFFKKMPSHRKYWVLEVQRTDTRPFESTLLLRVWTEYWIPNSKCETFRDYQRFSSQI